MGAICLHGIRTAEVALGDTVAVIGLGLLGQITVQLLKAAGCRVFGMDLLRQRTGLAMGSGAEATCTSAREFRDLCFQKTGGVGVDSVLITAETPSSEPVNLAAELARDRAIVVAVGTVGMELQRKLYYKKNWISEFRAPMAPAVMTLRMSKRGAIIRLDMCAGRKRATSKPFCNSSRMAN